MTTLQPFPIFTAADANGNPLSGGKLYSYAAGTSTPLDTYTDNTTDSPNLNPVILNAAGQANVWYGDAMYKLVLYDANDVLQWEEDNIGTTSATSTSNGGFGAAEDAESASLVDLGTIASHFANITGTVTINSFGTSASIEAPIYLIKFESALTLTNSASLFLPGSADVLTAQNDRALVEYLGSGAWRVFSYMRADGSPLYVNTIAGALSLTGDISPSQLVANTDDWAPVGFSTASSIRFSTDASRNLTGIAAGTDGRLVVLSNIGSFPLVIKNDATSTAANRFLTPNGLDYSINGGGSAIIQYDATSSRWRVVSATGNPRVGQVIQSVRASTSNVFNVTAIVPFDNTIPQTSEGLQIVTVAITPTSSSNILRVTVSGGGTSNVGGTNVYPMIFRDSNTDASAVGFSTTATTSGFIFGTYLKTDIVAGSTAATTLKFYAGVNTGAQAYFNANNSGGALFGGTSTAEITVEEISA